MVTEKVTFDISEWGLFKVDLHPLIHDYYQGIYHEEVIQWFAAHGYAISPTFDIYPTLLGEVEPVIVYVPETLALEFKLRWAKT